MRLSQYSSPRHFTSTIHLDNSPRQLTWTFHLDSSPKQFTLILHLDSLLPIRIHSPLAFYAEGFQVFPREGSPVGKFPDR